MAEKCLECDICGKSIYDDYFIEDERQVIKKNWLEASYSVFKYCAGVNTKSIVCPNCADKIHKYINSLKREKWCKNPCNINGRCAKNYKGDGEQWVIRVGEDQTHTITRK